MVMLCGMYVNLNPYYVFRQKSSVLLGDFSLLPLSYRMQTSTKVDLFLCFIVYTDVLVGS